jgi:hypothetical protein
MPVQHPNGHRITASPRKLKCLRQEFVIGDQIIAGAALEESESRFEFLRNRRLELIPSRDGFA